MAVMHSGTFFFFVYKVVGKKSPVFSVVLEILGREVKVYLLALGLIYVTCNFALSLGMQEIMRVGQEK